MKIGELASKTGCLVETIRYYEKEGLLPDALRDPVNNYRRYTQHHFEVLTFIRRCRVLDMTHEEIRFLLSARADPDASCESVNELIEDHLSHVQEKLIELQALEKQLFELKNSCNMARTTQDCGILQELEQKDIYAEMSKSLSNSHVKGVRCSTSHR